jgi:predicted acylesterase/phospholipase RssA/CRP-like cAMP-binding protein
MPEDVRLDAVSALSQVAAFRYVPPETLDVFSARLRMVLCPPGEALIRKGQPASEAYVIVEGTARVEQEDGRAIAELGPGDMVGEIAVLAGGTRSATVRAVDMVEALAIPQDVLADIVRVSPTATELLVGDATRRLKETRLLDQIERLFGSVDPDVVRQMMGMLEWIRLSAGAVLFEAGEPSDAAYFVVGGRLRVATSDETGTEYILGDVGPGDMVGEIGLLDDEPRSATVYAARDSDLVRFSKPVFQAVVSRYPLVMLEVARTVLRRTRSPVSGKTAAPVSSMVLVPLGTRVDLRAFAGRLANALGRLGPTVHLWSAKVDNLLSHPGAAQSDASDIGDMRLTQWLEEIADSHRFTVYEADREWSAWSRRALRHADQIVLVAHASESPEQGPMERRLREAMHSERYPHTVLVLLQDPRAERPVATAPWLEARRVDDHHHVRGGSVGDFARLARILGGEATSLVLSGGGARGFAHLGVLQSLEELGVPVDMVAGTSIGSVMASVVAMDVAPSARIPLVVRQFRDLLDYTLPLVSMTSGRRVTQSMREVYGDRDIEDLWLPFFCVSTSLTRARTVLHRRGPLVQALRASVAIPGLFPPVPDGDDLLVDGGLLNNLPVDVMRRRNQSGTIVAVDVAPPMGPSAKEDFGLHVSGWSILGGRILPGRTASKVPGITDTLLRSTLVAAMRDRDRYIKDGLADLYLDLDLHGWGLLAFDAVAEVARRGYELAAPRIEKWLATREEWHV